MQTLENAFLFTKHFKMIYLITLIVSFSWASRENFGMTGGVIAQGGAEDSVRLILTKNSPWCQVYGFSFEQFPRP